MTKYNQLNFLEKQKMIGDLQHAIMVNDQIFAWAAEMIEAAKYAGIIKDEVKPDLGVKIPTPLATATYYQTSSNEYVNERSF